MGNDIKINKMTEQRHKEVLMFLQDELEPLKHKSNSETYNLEKEYAKTKKNKSPVVVLLLLGCFAVVALVAFGLSKSIDKTNKEIKVNLEEFNDVNLKNLLDTVARTQSQYEAAVRNKATLEAQKQSEISAATSKRDNDILVVTSLNLSNKKQEQKQIDEINSIYADRVKVIESSYETSIAAASAEVEEYRKKLDEYDQSKLASEQAKSTDSQRKLQDLERKQLVQKYEKRISDLEQEITDTRSENNENMKSSLKTVSSKYQAEIDALDPIIRDTRADSIVRNVAGKYSGETTFENHAVYSDGAISKDTLAADLEKVKNLYNDYKYLDKMVLDIPHKHTIGDYVITTDKIVDDISVSFADVTYSLYEDVISLEGDIAKLEKEKKELINQVEEYQKLLGDSDSEDAEKIANNYENFLKGVLATLNTNAIVQSAETKETVYIYVHSDVQPSISGEGVPAEIRGKKTVKGKVLRNSDGKFVFEANTDKNGTPTAFELEGLVGSPVKLTIK